MNHTIFLFFTFSNQPFFRWYSNKIRFIFSPRAKSLSALSLLLICVLMKYFFNKRRTNMPKIGEWINFLRFCVFKSNSYFSFFFAEKLWNAMFLLPKNHQNWFFATQMICYGMCYRKKMPSLSDLEELPSLLGIFSLFPTRSVRERAVTGVLFWQSSMVLPGIKFL